MLFDLYWRAVGLPLSRLKGLAVDALPFSVVEVSLWIGATATLAFALSFAPRPRPSFLRSRRARLTALLAGPVFLIALGLGQGAFPWSLAPTASREPLTTRLAAQLGADSLDEATFRAWVAARADSLRASLARPGGWDAHLALREHEALRACDTLLDTVLHRLGLPPGRTVRAFKTMGPWTTTLGLAYGGPAFHDPFFGEIAIVGDEALPAPRHWRLIAACHEAAHAKGFTREMDAEILTQLALRGAGDPRLHAVADIHFLRKAGIAVAWPDSLIAESARVRARRLKAEAGQPVARALRRLAERIGFRNDAAKYGARAAADAWNPHHPFYATVRTAEAALRHVEAGDADDARAREARP